MDEDEDFRYSPQVWVTQWADFSSKYGLAYKLSNNFVGAHYNDGTKLVWKVGTHVIEYMERKKSSTGAYDERQTYNDSNYPDFMNKKITLIKYFKSFFEKPNKELAKGNGDGGMSGYTGQATGSSNTSEDVYVKRWLRTRHAIIFRLSNKTVHVCFFDRTEIIISSEAKLVTYTDHSGRRTTHSLKTFSKNPQPDLEKRLSYTKDILYQLIHIPHSS